MHHQKYNLDSRQKQNLQNQRQIDANEFQQNPQKKKSKLLQRKNRNSIPLLLNQSYVFKISESLIINEKALKEPEYCTQSFMSNVFYFKSIQSINLNENFLSLNLKEIQNNQFPFQYYTQRFKSFGDQEFYDLAVNLEMLSLQYSKKSIALRNKVNNQIEKQHSRMQLQQYLAENKGKRILCFYSEPTGDHVTMNRIIMSNELLIDLGYNLQQICKDFLKYRHVFFQIFDTTLYYKIVKKAGQRLKFMREPKYQNTGKQPNSLKQQNQSQQRFNDYVFRIKKSENGIYQEKVRAQIRFFKPQSNISIYQVVGIDQQVVIEQYPKNHIRNSQIVKKWEQGLLKNERETLKKIKHEDIIKNI